MAKTKKTENPVAGDDALLTVVMLTPVRYDGADYAEGETLSLPADAAERLIATGAARAAP